jgi:hypothetical protein
MRLATALWALFVLAALADELPPGCKASFDEAVADLRQRFQEEPIGLGVSEKSGFPSVIFAGPKGRWTMVSVLPNGAACAFDGGHGWRAAKRPGEPT